MRNSAPPDVRKRLAPFPASWEPDSGDLLVDQLIASLVPTAGPPRPSPAPAPLSKDALPTVLPDLPYVESHPWLSHPMAARLRYELQSIDLVVDGEPEHEGPPEGESDGVEEVEGAGDLRARAEAIQAPLTELKAEILENLPRWTEQRNGQLATQAAMRKKP
jgi:hypothetical protein